MKILFFEDNHFQIDFVMRGLRQHGLYPQSESLFIDSERDFYRRLDEIVEFGPKVAVLDVMARWKFPSPEDGDEDRPGDVQNQGYQVAGIRCAYLLRTRLPRVPIIFYTIVESEELRKRLSQHEDKLDNIFIVTKGEEHLEILDKIREAIRNLKD